MSPKRTVVVVDNRDLGYLRDLVKDAGGRVAASCSYFPNAESVLARHQPTLLLTGYCAGRGITLAKEWGGPAIIISWLGTGGLGPSWRDTVRIKAPNAVALSKHDSEAIRKAIREKLGQE